MSRYGRRRRPPWCAISDSHAWIQTFDSRRCQNGMTHRTIPLSSKKWFSLTTLVHSSQTDQMQQHQIFETPKQRYMIDEQVPWKEFFKWGQLKSGHNKIISLRDDEIRRDLQMRWNVEIKTTRVHICAVLLSGNIHWCHLQHSLKWTGKWRYVTTDCAIQTTTGFISECRMCISGVKSVVYKIDGAYTYLYTKWGCTLHCPWKYKKGEKQQKMHHASLKKHASPCDTEILAPRVFLIIQLIGGRKGSRHTERGKRLVRTIFAIKACTSGHLEIVNHACVIGLESQKGELWQRKRYWSVWEVVITTKGTSTWSVRNRVGKSQKEPPSSTMVMDNVKEIEPCESQRMTTIRGIDVDSIEQILRWQVQLPEVRDRII